MKAFNAYAFIDDHMKPFDWRAAIADKDIKAGEVLDELYALGVMDDKTHAETVLIMLELRRHTC